DVDHIHNRLENAGFGPRGLLMVVYGVSLLLSGAAILLHGVDVLWVHVAVLVGFAVVVVILLTKLGYVVTLWNSQGIVWLRRRLMFVVSPRPLNPGNGRRRG
ncbi:MAG: hypothetical protein ABR978_03785, partial [Dehalococcoidia bacterium]